jgi:feruloyl esterase
MTLRIRRRLCLHPALVAPLFALALPVGGAAASEACSTATVEKLAIPGLVVEVATLQPAGAGLPEHCVLRARVGDRTGSDGKHYAIRFEMRLPAEWNGRFLHQGNGGSDGDVRPAVGDISGTHASGGVPALARGFAVLSSDSGHPGADPANASLGLAAGVAFGFDAEARRDYGYAADMRLAPIAKAIIEAQYGRRPDFSYYGGCSNGGRHAMVAASRMPAEYDGFLAGNPGFDLPRAALQHAWDPQSFVWPTRTSASRSRRRTPRSCRARSRRPATSSTGSRTASPPISPPARRFSPSTASSAPRARPRIACPRPRSTR